jgi:hypothetical protein
MARLGLSGLLPLRADLMAGDLRCLYLGWLAAVANQEVEDDEVEPPVPAGLQKLSGPLTEFAEFLYLSKDLIAVAAEASPRMGEGPGANELARWIAALPEAEKNRALVRMMQGEGAMLANEMMVQFRRSSKPVRATGSARSRRTAKDLRQRAEAHGRERAQREAEQAAGNRERDEQKRAAARAKHLDSLQGKETQLWRQVDELVSTKHTRNYDEALTLLKDLYALWQRGGTDFQQPLHQLLERHASKSAFRKRVRTAGLER